MTVQFRAVLLPDDYTTTLARDVSNLFQEDSDNRQGYAKFNPAKGHFRND